jgi:hypothetical protein
MWKRRTSGVVLAVAAFACLATSQLGWVVVGVVPSHAAPRATQVVRVAIESTRAPLVRCAREDSATRIDGDDKHGVWLCPPGEDVKSVVVMGKDGGSGGGLICGGERKPPPDEKVTVAEAKAVDAWTWTEEALEPADPTKALYVRAKGPFLVWGVVTRDGVKVSVHALAYRDGSISVDGPHDAGTEVRVVVTAYGVCDAIPCTVPAGVAPMLEVR